MSERGKPIAAAVVMATGPRHRSSPTDRTGPGAPATPGRLTPTWATPLGGKPTIHHVIDRLARCRTLHPIVVVGYRGHVAGLSEALPDGVQHIEVDREPRHHLEARMRLARAFSPSSWRGGIGGASCYDEWLDPGALAEVMTRVGVEAAVAVAADWPLVDPALCDRLAERYAELPEKHRMVFTQAAPGLGGLLLERSMAGEMDEHRSTVGWALDYNPAAPKVDPVGRDVCVQIDAALRAPGVRASMDAPRWRAMVEAVYEAGVEGDVRAAVDCMSRRARELGHALPQQITVELTPRREGTGPAAPAAALGRTLNRDDMAPGSLAALARSLAAAREGDEANEPSDIALTFGGLGDPLSHPAFDDVIREAFDLADARARPFAGLAFETDLLAEPETVDRLIALGLPMVIKARLNAASAETYRAVMGVDGFQRALDNLARLAKATRSAEAPIVLVPTMVKLRQNVHELEPFVDRWQGTVGAVLVTGPSDGGGLVDDHAVIDMAPPRRFACRQLAHRMTVLSDGTVPRCDEDWLGREAVGNINDQPIAELWARLQAVRLEHERGVYRGLCERCRQWHRP